MLNISNLSSEQIEILGPQLISQLQTLNLIQEETRNKDENRLNQILELIQKAKSIAKCITDFTYYVYNRNSDYTTPCNSKRGFSNNHITSNRIVVSPQHDCCQCVKSRLFELSELNDILKRLDKYYIIEIVGKNMLCFDNIIAYDGIVHNLSFNYFKIENGLGVYNSGIQQEFSNIVFIKDDLPITFHQLNNFIDYKLRKCE